MSYAQSCSGDGDPCAGHEPQEPSFFLSVSGLSSCLNSSASLESGKVWTSSSVSSWPKGKNFTPFLFVQHWPCPLLSRSVG